MIKSSEEFCFSFILLCIASLFIVISSILYFRIIISIFWKIIEFIRYLGVNIIWGNIVRFSKFIWNSVIKPVWDWIKGAFWSVYNFIANIINKIIETFKNVFNLGKKITNKVVEVGESSYNFVKEVVVNVFNIGEGIVIKGVNIIQAIYNFFKNQFLNVYNIVRDIFDSVINFFKSIGEFFSGIADTIINIF